MVSIVHNGSKITERQSLALSIFNVCARHANCLEIKRIARSFNYRAGFLSRTIDLDDYTIHDDVWLAVDIYRAAKRRGEYPTLAITKTPTLFESPADLQ